MIDCEDLRNFHDKLFPVNPLFRWASNNRRTVLACSALKKSHRRMIGEAIQQQVILYIYLQGDKELLQQRISTRQEHFYPPMLLDSQLEILEPPTIEEHAITINVMGSVLQVVNVIRTYLSEHYVLQS